jgi:hypothetical protein
MQVCGPRLVAEASMANMLFDSPIKHLEVKIAGKLKI